MGTMTSKVVTDREAAGVYTNEKGLQETQADVEALLENMSGWLKEALASDRYKPDESSSFKWCLTLTDRAKDLCSSKSQDKKLLAERLGLIVLAYLQNQKCGYKHPTVGRLLKQETGAALSLKDFACGLLDALEKNLDGVLSTISPGDVLQLLVFKHMTSSDNTFSKLHYVILREFIDQWMRAVIGRNIPLGKDNGTGEEINLEIRYME